MPERMDPEFLTEKDHLAYTKKYMEGVLKETESIHEKYKGNVQEALAELDDKDSSSGYTSLLSNTKFLELALKEMEAFRRVKDKPYFARIDFMKKGSDITDQFYLGKTSLYERETQEPIIVDWRSPVASVYYDGRLGDVSYESYEGTEEGYLSLKRQYRIESGKLLDFADVDLTANDDLLLEALGGKADNRLTEIITTIQAEQNQVIRADLRKPIIVQGAAGSGKTTIALHRLSYFIYHFRDKFNPEQMMIIAPNNMFIGYIGEVLPELGVEKIKQTTYIDYVLKCIGKKFKVLHPEKKLVSLINHEFSEEGMVRWLSEFKGSLDYKKLIDRYLKVIRNELSPKDDFYLERFKLVTGKKLRRLFRQDYSYLPFYKRLEKIKNVLRTDVRQKKKQIIPAIQKRYDDLLDKALEIKTADKRREMVVHYMDTKEARIKSVENDAKTAVKKYVANFPKETLLDYYKRLFADPEKLLHYGEDLLTVEQASFFAEYNQKLLAKNQVEIEDLAALYYMQHIIFGIDKDLRVKNVVIDEAQDYSMFQLFALKEALETEMFTIVGDLAQGIHSYRGLKTWQPLMDEVFPRANYVTLQKSYRTTIEIMDAANKLLKYMDEDLPLVEPVVRHGEKPKFEAYENEKELVERVSEAFMQVSGEGYQSLALIGKTEQECKDIYKLLAKNIDSPVQLLKENEELKKGHLVILPSYLSKGLEFDAVLIVSLYEKYAKDEIDIKLLYVAMTRPMHRLYMFAKSEEDLLLS